MSIQLFFINGSQTNCRWGLGGRIANRAGTLVTWSSAALLTTRGAAPSSRTIAAVTGPTNGIEWNGVTADTATAGFYVTPPLSAPFTISGTITLNLRGSEAAMTQNAAINAVIEKISGADGSRTTIATTANTVELGTAESANNFNVTPTSTAMVRGDRIRVVVYADDSAAATMASGGNLIFWLNGPTAAASGDSWIQFTENLTFEGTSVSGDIFYPTDDASAVAGSNIERQARLNVRGAGVQSDPTSTATGPTSGIQMTDTAGGTAVEWYTRPLDAFTLAGPVLANTRVSEGATTANASFKVEIAIVDNDGTNAVVWATNIYPNEITAGEAAFPMYLQGDDVAVTSGQRLRIRYFVDDSGNGGDLVTGQTVTLFYAGTSAAASGDTYLQFTNTGLVEQADGGGGGATEDPFPIVGAGYYG